MELLESIGDPSLTVGLGFVAFACWYDQGEFAQILRWSQTVIDLSGGDPAMGAGFGFGSPLAAALAFRGVARWWLGRPGWRDDLRDAVVMAQDGDRTTLAFILAWTHGIEIAHGVLRADDSAVRAIEHAVQGAQEMSDDNAVMLAEFSLSVALLNRDVATDRERGLELMERVLDILRERVPSLVPVTEVWISAQKARGGEADAAIPVMRRAVDELHQAGRIGYLVAASATLAEALLKRCDEGDLEEAQQVIERLSRIQGGHELVMLEITLLRLRALLAGARGDDSYRGLVDRYRAMAESLEFDGHIAWAAAMPG
jgi:hypothetical protein